MKRLSLITLLFAICLHASSQSVGIGTNSPDASAILDVSGTNGGLLIPRLTAAQRDAIASPAKGLVVFISTDNSFYCFDGAWKRLSAANDTWGLQGNSGTSPSSHYIGTSDGVPLNFGVNAIPRMKLFLEGRLELYNDNFNTMIGQAAGQSTTGSYNTFLGVDAAGFNQSGQENTVIGAVAGLNNITGRANVIMGFLAGYATNGNNSTIIGSYAGTNSLIGELHCVGYEAGRMNQTGVQNHFSGFRAGRNNVTGSLNHFSGWNAGYSNTTGGSNVYLGFGAGYTSNGSYNVFVGSAAGFTTANGSYNTAVGNNAAMFMTDGIHNDFSGYYSGYNTTTGSFNAFSGSFSGMNNTTGQFNTIYGFSTGLTNTTGTHNILLGAYADCTAPDLVNAGAIGYNAKVSQNNSIVLGGIGADAVRVGIGVSSPAHTLHVNGSVAGVGAYNNISDSRLKTNISPITNVIAGILQLQPVSYDWKKTEYPQFQFDDKRQIGFLAQDLEKIFPEAVTLGSDGFYTISYSTLIPVVVQAIKEQQQQADDLKKENRQLKTNMEMLQQEIETIKKQLSQRQQ